MVHYPELDHATRREIWAMFSKRLSLDFTNAELDNLAEHKLNGRQVRYGHFLDAMGTSNAVSD